MNPEQTAGGETSGFPPEDTGRRRGPQAIPATSTTSSVSRNSSSSKASATVHRNVLTGTHAAWRTIHFVVISCTLTLFCLLLLLRQRVRTTLIYAIFRS
jgi:hypothetical protein